MFEVFYHTAQGIFTKRKQNAASPNDTTMTQKHHQTGRPSRAGEWWKIARNMEILTVPNCWIGEMVMQIPTCSIQVMNKHIRGVLGLSPSGEKPILWGSMME